MLKYKGKIMLRTIATPTTNRFVLNLPNDLINKKIEFIAFPIEEEKVVEKRKTKSSGYGTLKGKIHMSDDFDEPLDDFKEYM